MTELPIVVNMTVDASRTEYDLTAESNLEEIELLNDTVIETGGSHVPIYEGPYTVDAGLSAVTLDTDGKRLTQDVTVNALTENYISGNDITVNANGRVSSFVSVSAGYSPNVFAQMFYKQLDTQARATITPTASEQTAVARGKYTTGAVKVRAIPAGTRGTPTATKGAVSNHSVSVTPSVTNTTGYITGGTINGTAVSVSASELVSGKKTISANGDNIDVTNYATVKVNVPTGITPTGTYNISANGTYDITNYQYVEVEVVELTEQTIATSGAVSQQLDIKTLYHFTGSLTSLTVTLATTTDIAEYHFDFNSGSTAPTLNMPQTVIMPDSFQVETNKHYEVDILNNYGTVKSWSIS